MNLAHLRHTRTCRFEYKRWFAYDTVSLLKNFENLLQHCNPILLKNLEDIHEDMVVPSGKMLKNLRSISMKSQLHGPLVESICTLHRLTELYLTEKPNPADLSQICLSLVKLKSLRIEMLTDEDLQSVVNLTSLDTLDALRSKITDEGLLRICTLLNLRNLLLKGCINITDEGIPSILLLKSLEKLDLSGSRITDESATYLSRLPLLEHLTLQETRITDSTLKHLSNSKNKLRSINIAACQFVTNIGMNHISKLLHLESLNVGHTCLEDETLGKLCGVLSLRRLDISNSKITDEGFQYISTMDSLIELVSAWNVVSNVGVRHLFSLKKLTKLNVIGCKNVSSEVLYSLYTNSTSLENIRVSGNKITDFYRKLMTV